jgi:hypothetical protein
MCSHIISTYNCVIIAYLGDTHSDDESDPENIFEPVEESATCDGKNTIHTNHFHPSYTENVHIFVICTFDYPIL